MKDKRNLIVCAAGDRWLDKVIDELKDKGITAVPYKVPEQLWETAEECLGILISMEEINSLYSWLNIKDFYKQNQSEHILINEMTPKEGNNTVPQGMLSTKDAVKKLCSIQNRPVIIVFSAQEDEGELACLQAGAAECVSMSRSVSLAAERIWRQLTEYVEEDCNIIQWNCVILNQTKQQLHVGNRSCYLSGREYKVFVALLEAQGSVVSRYRLAALLWGEEGTCQHRNLDAVLSVLRRRLKDMELEIATRYREGYYLRECMKNYRLDEWTKKE